MAIPALAPLRLVAGAQGLDRAVRWIYFADVIDDMDDSPEWVNGHELVVFSGTAYAGSAQKLARALRKLNDMDIAGFIINVGPYIREIPQEVISTADELKLPLFRLPWEFKLVNITHAICNAIISNEIQESRASSMLEGLLFGDMKTPQELEDILTANRLTTERGCVVGLCSITNPELLAKCPDTMARAVSGKKSLQNRLDDAFAWAGFHAITTTRGNDVVFLAPNLPDVKSRLSGILQNVENELNAKCPGLHIHTGLGFATAARLDLKKGYRQAKQALCAANVQNAEARISSYDDLGLLSLLLDIDDQSLLKSYFAKTLGALVEYDKVNRTDLYHTLEAYYENNTDPQNTAQVLYIHKNTLKYRLERISEILGCNIRHTDEFLSIGIAIQVGRILNDRNHISEKGLTDI